LAPTPTDIPLFELPLVALPTERVPLHIFEQRYKRMIAYCRGAEEPLAIVLRTDAGTSAIGCAAEITEILEEFDDGRLNLIVTGRYPIHVRERWQGEEFPMATIEPIEPIEDPRADPEAALASFRRLLEAVGSNAEPPAEMRSAFAIAARVEIGVEVKQTLLEGDSEVGRLELLRETLDELTEQADRAKRIAKRAQGNGHAPIEGL
jgi:Lon protease-like protein